MGAWAPPYLVLGSLGACLGWALVFREVPVGGLFTLAFFLGAWWRDWAARP